MKFEANIAKLLEKNRKILALKWQKKLGKHKKICSMSL
jgi:hypothetical protein